MEGNKYNIAIISATNIANPIDEEFGGGVYTHTKMLSKLLSDDANTVTHFVVNSNIRSDGKCIISESQYRDTKIIVFSNSITPSKDNEGIYFQDYFNQLHARIPFDIVISEGYYGYSLIKYPDIRDIMICIVHNFHLIHFHTNLMEVHGIRIFLIYLIKSVPALFYLIFKYEIPFMNASRLLISVSEINTKLLHCFYRIPKDKMRAIHNWVHTDIFHQDSDLRDRTRSELHIPADHTAFLVVGSMRKPKGFHIAIQAFVRFYQANRNSFLLIAGTGFGEQYIRSFVPENLKNNILFLGFCDRNRLPALYNAADIFILPSLQKEAHAYTLTEAMSCGLPVIATNRGGNPEILGDAGVLVPANDPNALCHEMLKLATNTLRMKELSALARARVLDQFTSKTALSNFKAAFNDIISAKEAKDA